ncbi:tyrosine-protein phosphatase [Salinactinospora qingdaonensis]|uniref:Tyrosine-protein phosphatase PtbB n=1 Tax=Salinactinospora qingdaonensis TaxID=702744 RepID=A0ABP7FEN8_9ACTN
MPLLNFRDVADTMPARPPEGAGLRRGRLFRSAMPFDLTAAEAAAVHESGVRTVLDLRSDVERRAEEWSALTGLGVEVVHAPLGGTPATRRPGGSRRLATMRTPADLGNFYSALATRAADDLVQALETIAQRAPVLVQCAAGKDRTGLVVATALALLGVPRERIVADYARTAEALPELLPLLATHRSGGQDAPEAAQLADRGAVPEVLLTAPAEAIGVYLDELTAAPDGITGLLARAGAAEDLPQRLRDALWAGA